MHQLLKQSSQDHQHPVWKTLESISYNAKEIIGDMKCTKNQQTITGESTESPETNQKTIKENKTQFYWKVLSSKNCKEIWKVIHRILNTNMSTIQVDPSALNEFFNKTAWRLAGQNATTDDVILSPMD